MKLFAAAAIVVAAISGVSAKIADNDATAGANQSHNTMMSRRATAPGKVDHMTDITPACHEIQCADISCMHPLELVRREGQCCPICWAPDHKVALDRHSAGDADALAAYKADQVLGAPEHCAGAKCFKLHCLKGQKETAVPGACCHSCQ